MSDEKDLQAIREMMHESNKQTLRDAMQGASALMESYFEPKFNLLFENQQTIRASAGRYLHKTGKVAEMRLFKRKRVSFL